MKLETLQKEYKHDILAIAAKYGVQDIRIFGSVARGDARDTSDLDLLVHLDRGRDLFDLGGFYHDLTQLLPCKVDIVPDNAHIHFPSIIDEARPL